MNILLMSSTLSHGGAEHQIVRMANAFASRGHHVVVCSLIADAPLKEQLDSKVQHVELGVVRAKNLSAMRSLIKAMFKLREVVRSHHIDIVHTHTFPANLFSRVFKMVTFSRVVLINTSHTTRETSDRGYALYRALLPQADFCTHISPLSLKEYQERRIFGTDARYIPNGLNLDYFHFNPEARQRVREDLNLREDFVWICVGRFEEPKDHQNLIQAWKIYQKDAGSADRLLLVGDGPLMDDVRAQVNAAQLEDSVIFYGISKQVPDLLSAADALVLGSNREGLPLVLQEGAAIGLPIVCTDVGAVSEIVHNSKTGRIVPSRSPQKLAQGMLEVRNDPGFFTPGFKAMTRAVIKEKFDMHAIATVWIDLYQQLLSQKSGSGKSLSEV